MRKSGILSLLVWPIITMSCISIQSGKSTQAKKAAYSEDITAYRAQPRTIVDQPDTTISYVAADSAALPVTARLNIVLDTAAAYNQATTKFIDGFTIQVYGGNDRAVAKDYQLDIIRYFPDVESKMVFEQPNYKVRVGQYYTRLEAQEFFTEIRAVFARAILIPTRIYIK